MLVKVVDASALGALVFGEPKAASIAMALAEARLFAPALLWFELASICFKKIRVRPTEAEQLLAAFKLGSRLTIQIVEVDYFSVLELARRTDLTVYDASYLWLAEYLHGELVTLDKKMLKVVSRIKASDLSLTPCFKPQTCTDVVSHPPIR